MGTKLGDLLAGLATVNRTGERRRSLRDVAELVHLSPGRAQRVFTRFVGESPGRYQQRVSLDRAAASLLVSDRPIADLAFEQGFGSHEGFTRAFRARFGISPREYRNQASTEWTQHQFDVAVATSPCIGIYRSPLAANPSDKAQEKMMTSEVDQVVSIVELDETPVLFMARRIDREEFATVLAELLPAVFQYVMEQGLGMAGPPFVRYMEQSAAFLAVQAGIPLAEQPKPPSPELNIEAGVLPGGPAAVTVHRGPYDTLGDSHMVLDRWMTANDRQPAGAPWEVYLTDPGEVPDPKDWETQILWPVEPVG